MMAGWRKDVFIFGGLLNLGFLFLASSASQTASPLLALLPEVPGWEKAEEPRLYQPENLFEYIDGAAESYLSYEFKELAVAPYKRVNATATLTVEIYRMGSAKNAFGIYSAERYPESHFLEIGGQGYMEEGALNFFLGDKYVKLLSFEAGTEGEAILLLFARKIVQAVGEKGSLPEILQCFPRENLVANSEKFILRNFLGYEFLHDGYLASYKVDDEEFELFLIEGKDEAEAASMLEKFVAQSARRGKTPERIEGGYHLQDRYLQNLYLVRVKNYIAGVMRVGEGMEETGRRYLGLLLNALRDGPSRLSIWPGGLGKLFEKED